MKCFAEFPWQIGLVSVIASIGTVAGLLLTHPARGAQVVSSTVALGPFHPAAAMPRLRILVPAYFYPVPGSPWGRMNAAAAAYPGRITAIGNPFNGPGSTLDPTYATTFAAFRANGGRLIGYVRSSYGARPLAAVQADIDTWFAWYPIDGVFVDEMDNQPGVHETYYQAIFNHARSHLPSALVVGNPGASTAPSYLHNAGSPVVDVLCIYETSPGFLSWSADPWVAGYSTRHFYALPYNTPAASWSASIDHAFAQRCGWVYVTDDDLPNPWDSLPAYFEAMVGYVALNY